MFELSLDNVCRWTPRVLIATVGAYYGLGWAYEMGLMARIDLYAMSFFRHFFGRVGVGAFMRTFQWYAAPAVRSLFGLSLVFVYDVSLKSATFLNRKLHDLAYKKFL